MKVKALDRIVAFLDKELAIAKFRDSSNNGLQVANSGRVRRICCGVDASLAFFEEARQRGGDLVICHHGMRWNDSLKRIIGVNYKRLGFLISNDMALYACHLPLDAHDVHGNNAGICRALGLRKLKKFGLYNDAHIGFAGELPKPVSYDAFKKRVARLMRTDIRSMDFGKKTVRSVAVVSGGAAEELAEAGEKKIDVFLSGEPQLAAYSLAQEYGINAVFAGHYATETFGVRALADLLKRKFRTPCDFIDLRIPF